MSDDSVSRLVAGILAVVGLLAALPAAFLYAGSFLAAFEYPNDGQVAIAFFAALLLGGFGAVASGLLAACGARQGSAR